MKLRRLGYYVTMEPTGRVTIPQAIRNRLKFDPGEEYEVYSYGSMIGFKKHRPLEELVDIAEEMVNQIMLDRSITKPKRLEIQEGYEVFKKLIKGVAYRK